LSERPVASCRPNRHRIRPLPARIRSTSGHVRQARVSIIRGRPRAPAPETILRPTAGCRRHFFSARVGSVGGESVGRPNPFCQTELPFASPGRSAAWKLLLRSPVGPAPLAFCLFRQTPEVGLGERPRHLSGHPHGAAFRAQEVSPMSMSRSMTATTRNPKRNRTRSTQKPPAQKHLLLPREAVERRAYQRYLSRGATHGRDLEDWFLAEQELRRELGHSGKGE
jgi:hypothetical protein